MMLLMVSLKRSLRVPWSHPYDGVSGHPYEALNDPLNDPSMIPYR